MQNQESSNTQTPPTQNHQTGSLYVGDLEPNVTESVLFDVFRKVGPVASIRVCRDSSTRRSLGYAYVNYHKVEDAERALDTLNYTSITGGKPCRIMWSQRDPSVRKSGVGNIFIKDLHPSIKSQDLYDNFSQFGTILSCKVETELNGQSKGFGFVHFESVDSANKAIQAVNGIELEGKKVSVMPFKNKKQRTSGTSGSAPKFTNIYIKNLSPKVTENDLLQKFGEFGKITSCVIMYDENKVSKGFGFLNYESPESAKKAVEVLHESDYLGQRIYVARAQKRSERLTQLRKQFEERKLKFQNSNLYIKNLDDQIDDQKLRELFAQYGDITSAKVMRDETNGNSKGFGFVCFTNPEDAHKASSELNGRLLFNKPLYVALAQRKEIRTAQLQAQYSHRQMGKNLPQPQIYNNQMNQRNFGGQGYNQNFNMNKPRWGNANRQNNPAQMPYRTKKNQNMGVNNMQRNNQPQESNSRNQVTSLINLIKDKDSEERKRIIGDHLYQMIEKYFSSVNTPVEFNDPGKITGMFLESLDEEELLFLAEDPKELAKKIDEALNILQEHQQSSQDTN